MAVPLWLVPLVAVLVWLWLRRPYRPPGFPPGPPCFLIFGNLFEVLEMYTTGFREVLHTRRRRYGDINGAVTPTGLRIVNLCRYDLIREACAMPELSGRPEIFLFMVRSYMKKLGIIFNDGAVWREQRRFALRHLKDLGLGRSEMEAGILTEFEHLRREMERTAGEPMQVRSRFNLTVLNVLWRIVASTRLDPADPEARRYVSLINDFILDIRPTSPLGLAPWLRYLAPEWSGYASLVRQREAILNMFLKLVTEHRATLDRDHPRDFIDRFLLEMDAPDAAERGFTEISLAVTGMDFFLAGMETTSTQLSWALLFMVTHPDIQRRVQAEVDRVLAGRAPRGQDRLQLPLTEATLMEVMRRAPVLPRGVQHGAVSDCQLAGYTIPRGAAVMMNLEAVHMDPEYWGDPENFRPERFLQADGSVRRDERVIPFGVGRRFCLGEQLARAELFLMFTALLQSFTFQAVDEKGLDLEGDYGALLLPHPFEVTYQVRQ